MSKARITYRFDQGRQGQSGRKPGAVKEERVIPLLAEEYSVKEEPVAVQPDEPQADSRQAWGAVRRAEEEQAGWQTAQEGAAAGGRGEWEPQLERNAKRRAEKEQAGWQTAQVGTAAGGRGGEPQLERNAKRRTEEEVWPAAGSEERKMEAPRFKSLFEPHDFQSFTSEFSGWTLPAEPESESERVERAIRESRSGRPAGGSEAAGFVGPVRPVEPEADKREADAWSGWGGGGRFGYGGRGERVERVERGDSGERDDRGERGPWVEPELGVRYARSGRTSWLRIATSIAGAVVTGVAFGFFVLSLFSGNGQQTGETDAAQQAAVQASPAPDGSAAAAGSAVGGAVSGAGAAAGADGAGKSAAAGGPAAPVQIAAQSYAFLQNGVFSTLASAQAAQAELKKKGLASALEQNDKLTVFVGFAPSRDDALALSQQLQDKQLDVYIKAIDIPAAAQIRWSGTKPAAVGSFVGEAGKLVQTISGLTIIHLAESSPTALDDTSLQAIRAAHQAMTQQAAAVGEGIGDDVKPYVQQMTTAASSAVQSMEEYKKNPSAAMLWQAQSSMMQMIIAEKALMKQIAL